MLERLDLEVLRNEIPPDLAKVARDDAAIENLLIAAAPNANTRGEGFWEKVRDQFRIFLCTEDERYKEERDAFRQRGKQATQALMGLLTGAIISGLGEGILISTLVPFIALLLYTAAELGKEAYCATYRQATPS